MRKLAYVAIVGLAMPALAFAQNWENAPLVDHMCYSKVKADPDSHPTSCLLKCASSGYGIITASGSWLRLDDAGNKKAVAALKATTRKDHVRVNVSGELKGESIAVASLSIPN